MSTSSATPTDLFESLTIEPQMSSSDTDIRSRAIEVRDILSSFDRHVLPSEFKPQVFAGLDREYQNRPPLSQWTIQEDLGATLLQWGAYNEQAYSVLVQLQTSPILARCFHEKIHRRFETLLEGYDRLENEDQGNTRHEIQRIAQGFRDVVAAVKEDRPHRELGQDFIASRLIEALTNICRRHTDLIPATQAPATPRRGVRRSTSSSTEGSASLFDALIRSPSGSKSHDLFMLDVLETFPASVFANFESNLQVLTSLLEINDAPSEYKYRIGRLLSATSTAMAQASSVSAQTQTSTRRLLQAASVERTIAPVVSSQDPASASIPAQVPAPSHPEAATVTSASARTKRAAEETTTTTRRGKKKTNK